MNNIKEKIFEFIKNQKKIIKKNPSRKELIKFVVENKEALITSSGALATWNQAESTGRAPKDTVIVKHQETQNNIDWNFSNNIPIDPEFFDKLLLEALEKLSQKKQLFELDRTVGADPRYALPVKTISDKALSTLFASNMFRPLSNDIKNSVFSEEEFTLVVLPYDKIDIEKYPGKLRTVAGEASDLIIAMDFDRRIGLVYGTSYCGSIKKLVFTVMNYLLPEKGVLPLHCSANEDQEGNSALFLGLSGTGKTTLSADSSRSLIGDDEHLWSNNGIANMENGCYAKLIDLDPKKEPEIHRIVVDEKRDYLESGIIVENTMMYPDGNLDLFDSRLTENSRASYLLSDLKNFKKDSQGKHPKTILFLTADANGVLPPISKLNENQAKLWFLMGYTSKLAGTETGVTDPISSFSRFFGGPFMPRNPDDYTTLLGEKINKYKANVYLVNTGWSGGPYGIGSRMDIDITRSIVKAALNGDLEKVKYQKDPLFHIAIPQSCPGVNAEILNPKNTWLDKNAYEKRAQKLAKDFSRKFEEIYGNSIPKELEIECPGK